MPNKVTFSLVLRNKFSGPAKKVAKDTEKIRRKFRFLGPAARKAGRGVQGAFAGMKKAAVGFQASMAPLLAGLAGIAGVLKAFTVGADFEDALADLSSITGSTGKDLQFLADESLRLGKKTKTSSAEVANAFKLVASAKSELLKDPEALSKITEQVLLLSNATGIELSGAADVALTAMNQFGAGADEAGRFINVLAAGAKIGVSEVADTGEAVRKAGVAARLTGIDFEELNASIQVLAKNGEKGQIAGTGLKGVFLKLDASVNRNIRPSVVGLNKALENLGEMNLDNAQLTKLFGLESIRAGAILINNRKLVSQWTTELAGTNVAQEQAAVRLETTRAKMRGLGVTIANKVIKVFERLSPQFDNIIERMGKFIDSISADDVEGFAAGLSNIVSLMSQLASFTATVAGFLGPIFKLAGVSLSGLKDLGTLATGGSLTAANSASFKNATRLEKQEANVNIQLNAPAGAVASIKSQTSGKTSGLNVGVNMTEAA